MHSAEDIEGENLDKYAETHRNELVFIHALITRKRVIGCCDHFEESEGENELYPPYGVFSHLLLLSHCFENMFDIHQGNRCKKP